MTENSASHKRERRKYIPLVHAGNAYCRERVCLFELAGGSRWIHPDGPWDLAHDHRHGGYLGPAHVKCNRSEGARRKNGRLLPEPRRWEVL